VHSAAFDGPIPSVRPSVCPWHVGALRKRWEIGLWLIMRSLYRMSPLGYSGDPSPTFNPKRGAHNPSEILHRKLRPTMPDTTVICIDSLREHTITLTNSIYHRRWPLWTPLPQNGVVKKLNWKLLRSRNRYLTALHTRPVGIHWYPDWHCLCPPSSPKFGGNKHAEHRLRCRVSPPSSSKY